MWVVPRSSLRPCPQLPLRLSSPYTETSSTSSLFFLLSGIQGLNPFQGIRMPAGRKLERGPSHVQHNAPCSVWHQLGSRQHLCQCCHLGKSLVPGACLGGTRRTSSSFLAWFTPSQDGAHQQGTQTSLTHMVAVPCEGSSETPGQAQGIFRSS